MKCWRCGREISDGTSLCPYCGAQQGRAAAASEVGRALRLLYDRYGAQAVLSVDTYIVYGLGDLVEDAKKTRNLFRSALSAGIGRLYLEQLHAVGKPDAVFCKRAETTLTRDAGIDAAGAAQVMAWLDEMIGWETAAPKVSASFVPSKIIGIDLGTTCTRAAVVEADSPVIIPTAGGQRFRPSVVGWKDGRMALCEDALRQGVQRPPEPVKFLLRRPRVAGQEDCAQFYVALLLRQIVQDAENYLGEPVRGAVVTVPDCFNTMERQAVLEAGAIASVEIVRLMNASTASAAAACWQKKTAQKVLACDLGGGYLSACAAWWDDGVLETQAAGGSGGLGGEAYDARVADWLKETFRLSGGGDVGPEAADRLRQAARKAREELSAVDASRIYVPYLASAGRQNLDVTLSRAKFDELTRPLVDRAVQTIRQVMEDAQWKPGEGKLLLTGGASRIPAFREAVRRLAGQREMPGVHPDEAAAQGAALLGDKLAGAPIDMVVLECTATAVGIRITGDAFSPIIPRNCTVPTKKSDVFTTQKDNANILELFFYQGNGEFTAQNDFLGTFQFRGISRAAAGAARVTVTLDMDLNGIVTASIQDPSSGQTQNSVVLNPKLLEQSYLRQAALRAKQAVPLDADNLTNR